jgi:hypothetical protein
MQPQQLFQQTPSVRNVLNASRRWTTGSALSNLDGSYLFTCVANRHWHFNFVSVSSYYNVVVLKHYSQIFLNNFFLSVLKKS